MNKIAALIMVSALTGCATTGSPVGSYYQPVIDPSQANTPEYMQALQECNAIANDNTSMAGSTATGAVGGAAIAAGLGAIVGAILGVDVGTAAGAAAAIGGTQGAIGGAAGSLNKSQTIVRNCLVSRGFKVYY